MRKDFSTTPPLQVGGARLYSGFLDRAAQTALVERIRDIARRAPFVQPETKSGAKMSVRMTAAGNVGWTSDRCGYRYAKTHQTGVPWPEIPEDILDIWSATSGVEAQPDTCLVNFYGEGAKMGLHQDRDEASFTHPVVSVSLGDDALFRIGGTERKGPTESIWLKSGDVLVLTGPSRLAYHGIDRIRFRSSQLLPDGGRINLTLRVAG